jgi:hypothetical protein
MDSAAEAPEVQLQRPGRHDEARPDGVRPHAWRGPTPRRQPEFDGERIRGRGSQFFTVRRPGWPEELGRAIGNGAA